MIEDTETTSTTATEESTGARFSRAELEAMHGKPGRKPAEYYALFPKAEKPAKAKKAKAEKPAKAPKVKVAKGKKAKAEKPAKILKIKIAKAGKPGRKPRTSPGGLVAKAKELMAELNSVLADPTLVSYIEASDHDRRVIAAALKASKG